MSFLRCAAIALVSLAVSLRYAPAWSLLASCAIRCDLVSSSCRKALAYPGDSGVSQEVPHTLDSARLCFRQAPPGPTTRLPITPSALHLHTLPTVASNFKGTRHLENTRHVIAVGHWCIIACAHARPRTVRVPHSVSAAMATSRAARIVVASPASPA